MMSRSRSTSVSPPPNFGNIKPKVDTGRSLLGARSLSSRPLSQTNSKGNSLSPPPIVRGPTPSRLPNKMTHEDFFGSKPGPSDQLLQSTRRTVHPVLEVVSRAGVTTQVTTGFTPSRPSSASLWTGGQEVVVASTPTMAAAGLGDGGRRSSGRATRGSLVLQDTPALPAAPASSPAELVATPSGEHTTYAGNGGMLASLTRMLSPNRNRSTTEKAEEDHRPSATKAVPLAEPMGPQVGSNAPAGVVPQPTEEVTSVPASLNQVVDPAGDRGGSNKENVPGSPIPSAIANTVSAFGNLVSRSLSFARSCASSVASDSNEKVGDAGDAMPTKRIPLGEIPLGEADVSVIIDVGDTTGDLTSSTILNSSALVDAGADLSQDSLIRKSASKSTSPKQQVVPSEEKHTEQQCAEMNQQVDQEETTTTDAEGIIQNRSSLFQEMHAILSNPEKQKLATVSKLTAFLQEVGVQVPPKSKRTWLLQKAKRAMVPKRNRDAVEDTGDHTGEVRGEDTTRLGNHDLGGWTIKQLVAYAKQQHIPLPTPVPKRKQSIVDLIVAASE